MEAAIRELQSPGTHKVATVARKHGVSRQAVSRRLSGQCGTMDEAAEKRRLLNNAQESEIIKYIRRQCENCLPPSPRIVFNMAAQMCGKEPGKTWSSDFVRRHRNELDSRYLATLDLARHKADSVSAYQAYFAAVQKAMEQYNITPQNVYNMDEKGFMLGCVQRTKRIFTLDTYKDNKRIAAGQDGSREWITVVATICADGSALSPFLIFKAASGDIQDSWLQGFDPLQDRCCFAASPNGWSSDEHGYAWLTDIFQKETATKAGRSWRMLFVDGHASHLNQRFSSFCEKHRILVAVYPPHATHRLQPLDVSCFSPLANYYSQGLDWLMRQIEGFDRISKRDFFSIFWHAWHQTFTKKTVQGAWEKTGIYPWNPELVISQLPKRSKSACLTPPEQLSPAQEVAASLVDSPTASRKLRRLLNSVAAGKSPRTARVLFKLGDAHRHQCAQLFLAKTENERLKNNLAREKQKKPRSKKIMEQLRSELGSGALVLTPSKVRRAQELTDIQEAEEERKNKEKQDRKAEKLRIKAQKQAEQEAARQERQNKSFANAQRLAQHKADVQKRKEERIAKKAEKAKLVEAKKRIKGQPKQSQQPALMPEQPSRPSQTLQKRKHAAVANEAQEAQKRTKTRLGRTVRLPAKLCG